MFEDGDAGSGSLNNEDAFDLLQDIGRNTPAEIQKQRTHFRVAIKAEIVLQPGNASELLDYKLKGTTGDISEGGLSALFPLPTSVGDVYRLQCNRAQLNLPLTFARCVRCRLIREDAFESGFTFFTPISLPESVQSGVRST